VTILNELMIVYLIEQGKWCSFDCKKRRDGCRSRRKLEVETRKKGSKEAKSIATGEEQSVEEELHEYFFLL